MPNMPNAHKYRVSTGILYGEVLSVFKEGYPNQAYHGKKTHINSQDKTTSLSNIHEKPCMINDHLS